MNEKFKEFRNKYESIIYKEYSISETDNELQIEYTFEIPNLKIFKPTITINKEIITNKNINYSLVKIIVFNLGMVELISYYKSVCPKTIVIEAGYLDEFAQNWYKKLFYNGLGEFFYVNNIEISEKELFDFDIKGQKIEIDSVDYKGVGNLIPVGGGKDSTVTLELLNNMDNKCFIINPKEPQLECCQAAGYEDKDICTIKRVIDKNLLELNSLGFLNGHTPFSSMVSFVSYLVAYLSNKRYIVLSNEGSANEPTVLNTNINHQYSKSYEYERDFNEYTKKYFNIDINYFSLLRPIKEIQIAMMFSNYNKYHKIFKSCNVGSKSKPWVWCCNCPKCLFVYIILSPFLTQEERINIFGKEMYDNKELETSFLELIGVEETKPFECVGTIDEVIFSLNEFIKQNNELPYLVELYKNNYYKKLNIDLSYIEEKEHNVPEEYLKILKEEILKCINK